MDDDDADLREEIVRLEADIERFAETIESCRKLILIAKAALAVAINYGFLFQCYSFNWNLNATPSNGSNINFNVYGGVLSSVYTDTEHCYAMFH